MCCISFGVVGSWARSPPGGRAVPTLLLPTGAFLQWAAGIQQKQINVLLSSPPWITGVQQHGAEALASAQTPLPLTAAFLAAKIFALVFRALKMPAGFTPQEVSTNAPHSELALPRSLFSSLGLNFKGLKRQKNKKWKTPVCRAHPSLSSLQACTPAAYPALEICRFCPHQVPSWWASPCPKHLPLPDEPYFRKASPAIASRGL